MTTKTEERIKRLMDENLQQHIEIVNDRVGGVFFYGVIVGIVISYSGLLGYVAGVGTGVVLATKYKFIAYQISERGSDLFQNILKNINKK